MSDLDLTPDAVQGTVQDETWTVVGAGSVDGSGALHAPEPPSLPPPPRAQLGVVEPDGDAA
jgi:hypothetical protein